VTGKLNNAQNSTVIKREKINQILKNTQAVSKQARSTHGNSQYIGLLISKTDTAVNDRMQLLFACVSASDAILHSNASSLVVQVE